MVLQTHSKPSSPPTEVVEYEFSYSRSTGEMRWRHQGQVRRCKSIAGQVWCRRADPVAGRLFLVGELSIDGDGNATVWAPDGNLLQALQDEHTAAPANARENEWADFPQDRHSKRWRLCLNRAMKTWRIRDDDVDSEKIWNTNGYRGLINIRWMDSGPHIHVTGQPRLNLRTGVVQFDG